MEPERWLVVWKVDTAPVEVYPFAHEDDAREFYEKIRLSWTAAYLCRVERGVGVGPLETIDETVSRMRRMADAESRVAQLTLERDALEAEANAWRDKCAAAVPMELLQTMNADLQWIFGQPPFIFIDVARLLRRYGRPVDTRFEAEQAAAIQFYLLHYVRDPQKWRANATAELEHMLESLRESDVRARVNGIESGTET